MSKSTSIPITFGRITTTAASQLDTRVQKVNQGDASQNGQVPVNLDSMVLAKTVRLKRQGKKHLKTGEKKTEEIRKLQ